jgi:hypothetical protein
MSASPEYTQAIRERDEARAERDDARAALGRFLSELGELLRKGARSQIVHGGQFDQEICSPGDLTADQGPTPEPPPSTATHPQAGSLANPGGKSGV